MEKEKQTQFFEEIMNWTLPGLTFYYRDCEIDDGILSKYFVGQIIRSQIFVDVSSIAGKLTKSCRYVIASSKAAAFYKLNPETEKWKLHVINANSYFKVLDIYKKQDGTQICLLHIPEKGVEVFKNKIVINIDNKNIEDVEKHIIEKARESFDKKMQLPVIIELEESEWIERTSYPIGLDSENNFVILRPEN